MDLVDIERIALPLMEAHGCHTAILYGSRARGDATPESDVDLLFIREDGPSIRDARIVDGLYIDAFVYPEEALKSPDQSLLRALGGVILRERDGVGTALLARLQELHDRGPAPLPEDEHRALLLWSQKMLERIRGQGLYAAHRRMSLQIQALEDYFALRGAWFPGTKHALAWLRLHDSAAHALFERAARPDATDAVYSDLVRAVYRTHDAASP